jgi:probable F420-dependent oxidoreductase
VEAWQNFGFVPPTMVVELARIAEAAGIVGVSLPEHLVTPTVVATPNPYVPAGGAGYPPDAPFLDPFVAFAAMATATTQLRFLANVFVLPLRNLFTAAKSISSAAVLSGDRVALGIGIGWMREEFEAIGASFADRGARTDEMLAVLPALLRGEPVTAAGEHVRFAEVTMAPPALSPVPILVGGVSAPALRRAARADGWIGVNHAEAELMGILDRLRRAREQSGDERPGYRIVVSRPAEFDHAMATRYARAGVTAVVNRSTVATLGADADDAQHHAAMTEFRDLVAV